MGGAPGSLANQQTGIHTGLHVTRNMINDQFQKLSVPIYLIGGQRKILQVECGFLAEPHSHRGKEKETHEGFSLWLSWLAVLLVGAYARRQSRATWRPYSKK